MADVSEKIANIRHFADAAKANHSAQGFENPQHIVNALEAVADALDEIAKIVQKG